MRLAQKAREIRDASDQVKRYSEQTIRYTFVADSWQCYPQSEPGELYAASLSRDCYICPCVCLKNKQATGVTYPDGLQK